MTDVIAFPIPPIVKQVRIGLDQTEAFARFTEQVNTWWPLASLSVSRKAASLCSIEGYPGGRIFERDTTGAEHLWGRVKLWSPPSELSFSWHPGRPEGEAQTIHVRFESEATGGTVVTLVHSGWETLGDRAPEVHESYRHGWDKAFVDGYGGKNL